MRGGLQSTLLKSAGIALLLIGCRPLDVPAPDTLLSDLEPVAPVGFELVDFLESRRDAEWGVFSSLGAVAAMADGHAFFSDPAQGEIHRLDADGAYLGGVDAPLERIRAHDLSTRGRTLFALDRERRQVYRYSVDGAFRDIYLDLEELPLLDRVDATALAVDHDGRLAIADASRHQVIVVGPFLDVEHTVGEWGPFAGQFDRPTGIGFGLEGLLYAVDEGNRRVQAFDRTGFPVASSASVNDPQPPLVLPRGLDTDDFGNVYVCDEAAGEVVVFSPRLDVLMRLGGGSDEDGRLRRPVDCAVGPGDLLYVADPGRGAVLVYRILYS